MKVIVLKFEVSNASSSPCTDDYGKSWYIEKQQRLYNESEIQNIINDNIKDKNVVDIKVNTVDVNYHNNGRGNTVELWYTITYRE